MQTSPLSLLSVLLFFCNSKVACFLPNGHLFFPGSPAIGHFLRCDNQDAVYEECPLTTRHSVRIPLRAPPSGEPMAKIVTITKTMTMTTTRNPFIGSIRHVNVSKIRNVSKHFESLSKILHTSMKMDLSTNNGETKTS